MKFIVAALLLTIVCALVEASSPEECGWGAAYWCRTRQSAEKCGKVQYCRETVWERKVTHSAPLKASLKTPEVKGQPVGAPMMTDCEMCHVVLGILQVQVDKNSTEELIKLELDKLCSLLPGFSSICTELIDKNIDTVLKFISNELSPNEVCKEIRMCSSSQTSLRVKTAPTDLCDTCKLVVNTIKPFVDSEADEKEIKSVLDTVCGLLPGNFSSECTSLVNSYFELIWTLIKGEVDSGDLCELIKLCNSSVANHRVSTAKPKPIQTRDVKKPNDACSSCKLLVSFLKPYVDSNSTEQEVKSAIETLCSVLPDPYKDECNTLEKDYFNLAWDLVKSEFDNDEICKQLGLCTSSARVALKSAPKKKPTAPLSVQCDVCKLVVTLADKELVKNSTESEVKAAIESVCSALNSLKDECDTLVDTYFDVIWQALVNELTPDQVCSQIGLCSSGRTSVLSKKPLKPKAPQTVECDICKLVVELADRLLDSNSTESEAEAAAKSICSALGGLADECKDLIDKYFDQIWQLLVNELSPDQVCGTIGLCSSSQGSVLSKEPVKGVKIHIPIVCGICEEVVNKMLEKVESDDTMKLINGKLDNICDTLSSNIDQTECKSLLDAVFPTVWQFIVAELKNEVKSKNVCAGVGVCSSKKVQKVSSVRSPKNIIYCEACKLVVGEIDKLVQSNKTEAEILSEVEKICDLSVLKSYRSECLSIIDQYGKEVLQLIASGELEEVCNLIGLCSSSKTTSLKATKPKKISSMVSCAVCTEGMEVVKRVLATSSSQTEFKDLLDDVCSLLPSTVAPECKAFVDEYGPDVLKIIDGAINPKQMCQKLDLCSSSVNSLKWTALLAANKNTL